MSISRGRLRGMVTLPSIPPRVRMLSVLGLVILVMTISAAGILSGLGLYILAMITVVDLHVVLSSLLLSFSTAVFLLCYGWLTQ